MHAFHTAHRNATWWLAAIVGTVVLALATAAPGRAEDNPNNYACIGSVAAGTPEAGSEEQQVQYSFYCDGPITGYQLEAQIPVTGVGNAPPLVTSNATTKALTDTFSCSGEIPGWALNCVGATKSGYETVTGQFAVGTQICAEPRVDPLLTVTYAYLEKGVVTQAISGPYDLGRPKGCPADGESGGTRLDPKPLPPKKHAKGKKKSGKGGKKPAAKKK